MTSDNVQENIRLPPKWIVLNLNKRECSTFVSMPGDETLCQCGRRKIDHGDFVKFSHRAEKWSPLIHSKAFPTDAYGTILFEGEHHPNKAHYARLSYDTNPELVMHLLRYVWGLPLPKLVVSVHGGSLNFDLPTRLGKIFRNGITKVAHTTSAWVLSSGLNSGVSKHLGNALNNRWLGGAKRRHVVSIGIAPWGMCEHRSELIGRNKDRVYSPLEIHNSSMIHLNPRYSNFILVDNGSIGRFGGETFLRRKLEKCISTYPISQSGNCGNCSIPVVAIILEGGGHTLRLISEYVYDDPPVPIILFAGSGKITDLVAWMLYRFPTEEELFACREEVIGKIEKIFHTGAHASSEVFQEMKQIYQRKIMITVYNGNSASEVAFDTAILSSIFRNQHRSPLEQLALTMVWDRVDLAQTEVFVYGREWSRGHLEEAMMEALISNRLEFIELLMEHGINMKLFLTVDRLEKMYSTEANSKLMESLLMGFSEVRRISKHRRKLDLHERHLSLPGVGAALVQMGVYRQDYLQMKSKAPKDLDGIPTIDEDKLREQKFHQPFDDVFLWAVLTKRHELAKLLWTHGQASLAKALVASMLNNFFAVELAKLNISLVKEFENNREDWNKLSLSLLDSCYRQDFKLARKLLTMELKNWSQQNCLILAVMADHKTLLGHPSCQTLLADLWMGALNLKSNSMYKIVLATIFPPFALLLQYKSTEELMVFSNQDEEYRHSRDDHYATKLREQEILIPERESIRTFYPEKSNESVSNMLRSRYKVGRKTNLSEVVSKLEFGKAVCSTSASKCNTEGPICRETCQDSPQRSHLPFITVVERKYTDYRALHKHDDNAEDRYKVDAEQSEKFSRFVTTHQNLNACQKLIESQKAPITNFIRHFFGYLVFILGLWYVILYNQDPHSIGWVELYVTLWVFTQAIESIREFVCIEALTFSKKMAEMKENMLRLTDFFLVLLFMSGTVLRFMDGYFQHGMVIYRASSIYWNLRIYKYLAVHRFVGPKLLMMIKMFSHMASFAMIILVVIFSFAIARESIRNPDTDPTWKDIKPSFLEPYVMMFGEVDPLTEAANVQCIRDLTSSGPNSPHCPMGSWLIPIFWVVYMMISNILIVNVLIAVFNGIYAEIDSKSVEIWMSQQFTVVMEFSKKPLLPPPFIIISHFISLFEFILGKCQRCICNEELLEQNEEEEQIHLIMGNDHNLKAFLDPAEQEIVFDFEEENVDLLRHILTTDKDGKPPQGASQFGNAETAYRVMTSEKATSVSQLKNSLQELYAEMENQRLKIDKLMEYWEMQLVNQQKDKEEGKQADNDDDDSSSASNSDSSEDTTEDILLEVTSTKK